MAQQEYQQERTITFPGMVARIYRPILSDEERARRIKTIHKQAAELLKGETTK